MDLMKKLSQNYRVYEKQNIYKTDGPVKKCMVVFDAIEPLDKLTRIRISFSMESENDTLFVDITGEFILKIHQSGFFTDMFAEFYLGNVFPQLKKVSQKRAQELKAEIEKI